MIRSLFYWILGLKILALNKIRYTIRGYRTPRPFAVTDIDKAIAYDKEVIERWELALKQAGLPGVSGTHVLELGPGADLGVGLLLLDRGAKSYTAVDANVLISQTPEALYEGILPGTSKEKIEERLASIRFIHDPKFTLKTIPDASADFVVSNAAFEHFNDVPHVLRELGRIVAPGGVICIHVDLQTHTRVIRDRDPLNIYRFAPWLYGLMHFSGIPNRVRPATYIATLIKGGWKDLSIIPVEIIPDAEMPRRSRGIHRSFVKDETLSVLSFILTARR